MIQDELTQEAKSAILLAVRESLGLNYNRTSPSVITELDKSGYGKSFGRRYTFVLASKAIDEIISLLKTNFFNEDESTQEAKQKKPIELTPTKLDGLLYNTINLISRHGCFTGSKLCEDNGVQTIELTAVSYDDDQDLEVIAMVYIRGERLKALLEGGG